MPVPSSITDLSTTAGSNSPSGSESPITADDYLRTISAFVATLRDGKGQSAEATVASASTADIGAASSPFVQITGTTGITSLGTTYSGARYVRFAGALTLTHNATTLILPGAANITTAAGDTLVAVPTGNPGAGWRVVVYQRADGTLLIGSYVAKAGDTMTGTLTLPTLKASSSAGLILQNSAGTQVADFGPGPGTGVTFAGQVNASAFSGSGASLTEVGPRLSTSVTASGTAVDFTGIPSWAKRVNVMFSGLSTNGSATVQCQIGTSGGIQTTGYVGNTSTIPNSTPASTALSTGFGLNANMAASATLFGSFSVSLVDSANGIWAANGVLARGDAVANYLVSGAKTLSGVLDRIRITANGTDTFDAGTINVSWE